MSPTAAKKKTVAKAKTAKPKGELTRTPKPKKAKPEPGAPERGTAKAPKPKGPKYPGPVLRLLFPIATYAANKDAVKQTMKDEDLKFQYLGPGQGRYFNDKVAVFAKWGDTNADYTVRGDAKTVERLAAAWKTLGATDFTAEAKAEEEAAEVKAWKLDRPTARPGEPEFFLKKRIAEWETRDPRKQSGSP